MLTAGYGLFIPLGSNQKEASKLMSTIADLTTALTAEATAVTNLTTAVNALIAAYEAAKSSGTTVLSPADQAALDAAVAQVQSDQTALAGDTTAAEAAVNPPPPSPVSPAAAAAAAAAAAEPTPAEPTA